MRGCIAQSLYAISSITSVVSRALFCLISRYLCYVYFFFVFNDTATTEIYTLSLHDALPIYFRIFLMSRKIILIKQELLLLVYELNRSGLLAENEKIRPILRSSRSSYFATFRHQLTILSKTDALDEEKWLNMLGTFVKDWFRYESHFVHGRDSLVDILKERGLLSESDAVQPLIGKKS